MSSSETTALRETLTRRLRRYVFVSIATVVLNQVLLLSLGTFWRTSAALIAFVTSSVLIPPAYFAHRRWVWEKSGRSHWRVEVFPYLVVAVLGALLSTALVATTTVAARGVHSHFEHLVLLDVSYLGGYAVLWGLRYVALDRFIFRRLSR